MLNFSSSWLTPSPPILGAPPAVLNDWESFYGLALPPTLKGLLHHQNGGQIERLEKIYCILSLAQIGPLTEASIQGLFRVEPVQFVEAMAAMGVKLPWLVFPFMTSRIQQVYLLAYSEHSPKAEPEVLVWSKGKLQRATKPVEDWMGELVQSSAFPAVDLQEVASAEIVADESFSAPPDSPEGGPREVRQVLGWRDGQWMLFSREVVQRDDVIVRDRRTRAVFPITLQTSAQAVTVARPPMHGYPGTWSLTITPQQPLDVVFTRSYLTRNGKWQSEELHGEPRSFALEGTDEQRLVTLSQRLMPEEMDQSAPTYPQGFVRPNMAAITASLRRITDAAIRAPRSRLTPV